MKMKIKRLPSRTNAGLAARRSTLSSAFTLIELLTVVAIIAVLSGVSVRVLGGLGNGANGPRGGAAIAASILGTAREEAIMRRTTTRLLIDTVYPNNVANFLHRLTVVYLSPSTASLSSTTNWFQANKWESLPANTFIYYGSQNGMNNGTTPSGNGMQLALNGIAMTGTSGYDYIEFNPAGQVTQPPQPTYPSGSRVQLIVAPGFINTSSQALQVTGTNSLFGFAVFRLGRTMFFQDELAMQNQ